MFTYIPKTDTLSPAASWHSKELYKNELSFLQTLKMFIYTVTLVREKLQNLSLQKLKRDWKRYWITGQKKIVVLAPELLCFITRTSPVTPYYIALPVQLWSKLDYWTVEAVYV